MLAIPTDRPVFDGEIATYWFEDDGILVSLSKRTPRTVETIANNVALVKRITHNTRVPLLIYLSRSPVPDRATRALSRQQLPVVYRAMAMVSVGAATLRADHDRPVSVATASHPDEELHRRPGRAGLVAALSVAQRQPAGRAP